MYRPSSVIYQTPTVQPGPVIVDSSRIPAPAEPVGQRTNLPGVSFGAREHLGVLSDAVAERTTKLCELLKSSYQGNPQFQEVYQDTELLAAGARQIPGLAADSEKMLAAIQDLNTLFEALSPAIESWQSSGASASGPLSSVKSALQLLSTDAGYDPNRPVSRPNAIPAQRVAPRTAEPEPTPVDAVPTPADDVPARRTQFRCPSRHIVQVRRRSRGHAIRSSRVAEFSVTSATLFSCPWRVERSHGGGCSR